LKRPTVLISAHEQIDAELLKLFSSDLLATGQIDVILAASGPGGRQAADTLLAKVENANVVLVLFTPEYSRALENRQTTSHDQFSAINTVRAKRSEQLSHRHQSLAFVNNVDPLEESAVHADDQRFRIVVVLLDGTKEHQLPEAYKRASLHDLSGMSFTTWRSSGDRRPSTNFRSAFSRVIAETTSSAIAIHELQGKEYQKNLKSTFQKMFFKLKHDSTDFDPKVLNKIFVKTREFKKGNSQDAYIFVGRKGSGKSTLVDFMTYGSVTTRKYPTKINVNAMPLEYIYNIVLTARHASDQVHVIARPTLLRFAWQGLIYFCCFEALAEEHEQKRLSKPQAKRFQYLKAFLRSLHGNQELSDAARLFSEYSSADNTRRNAFFVYSLTAALEFLAKTINDAPSDEKEFNRHITASLTDEYFLLHLFSKDVLSAFLDIVKECQRNFLVSVDGFDNEFQKFRKDTFQNHIDPNVRRARLTFEVDWLSGLLNSVRMAKSRDRASPLAGKVDFCVTVPKDRFLEVLEQDRDSYEFQGALLEISWSGIELAILLRKRLEIYKNTKSDGTSKPLERLRGYLKNNFPDMPHRIPITLQSGRIIEIDLFQYVLRHSFWRPRDVLFLWGRIIASYEHLLGQGLPFTTDSVKAIVTRNLEPIVDFEFVREFRDYFTNIEEALQLFRGKPQLQTLQEFTDNVGPFVPILSYDSVSHRKHEAQSVLDILFQLGALGFYLLPSCSLRATFDTPWIFSFNEQDMILRRVRDVPSDTFRIVLHPVLIEYLGLKPWKENLVCDFPDEYLLRQEGAQGG
jgi:hypothetical protein